MPRSALALCLIAAVLILAACNLPTNVSGVSSARTALPTLTPSATAVALNLADDTATPTPSETTTVNTAGDTSGGVPVASSGNTSTNDGSTSGATSGDVLSSGSTSGGASAPPCVVQTDWPVYAVVRGDTLSSIARRTGSTATVLAAANCLADPNLLEPGQVLRVPRVPLPPTAIPPQYPAPGEYGSLTAAPLQNVEALPGGGTRLIVSAGQTVTIRWLDYPTSGLTQAEIVYTPSGQPGYPISLGIDTNPADGITVTWTVPANADGRLRADAPLPGQNHEFVLSPEIWVRAVTPQPTSIPEPGEYGTLRVVPALGTEPFDGTTRYRVQAGATVSVVWGGFPAGQSQVEIVYIPLDRTAPTVSLGIVSAPEGSVSVAWTVPPGANGRLLASAPLPGQNHEFLYSPTIWAIDASLTQP
jgi:LysM repeat protein